MTRLVIAFTTMVLAGSAAVAAQHAPEPKAHAEKAVEGKAADAKAGETQPAETKTAPAPRRAASPSPLQTAAAIEQILRKLREGANAPVRRQSSAAVRPRLRLAWRLTLNWPAALTDPQTP